MSHFETVLDMFFMIIDCFDEVRSVGFVLEFHSGLLIEIKLFDKEAVCF